MRRDCALAAGVSVAPPPSSSCVLAPGVLERLRVRFRRRDSPYRDERLRAEERGKFPKISDINLSLLIADLRVTIRRKTMDLNRLLRAEISRVCINRLIHSKYEWRARKTRNRPLARRAALLALLALPEGAIYYIYKEL